MQISRQIKMVLKLVEMSHKETEKKIKRVTSRMEEIKSSQERRFNDLSQHQLQTFQEILEKLVAHFKSEKTIKKFCDWSLDEVPAASTTWKETKSEALRYVSERTHQFIQQWEDDEHEFAKAQVSLIQYCTEKYDVMAEEIHVEEQSFLDESEADVSQDEEVTQSKSQKSTATTWLRQGLASVVVSSPRVFSKLGPKLLKMAQHITKLESYNDDPCSYMSKRSRKCLEVIAKEESLIPFINTQLVDTVRFLSQINEKISQLREGDRKLYKQLLEDKRSKTVIEDVYEPLKIQINLLQRSLSVYRLNEVRKSHFTDEELKCDEKWESIIGNGSFSAVYKGVLHRKGQPEIEVALKRYRDPLTTNNVWHFFAEERALR